MTIRKKKPMHAYSPPQPLDRRLLGSAAIAAALLAVAFVAFASWFWTQMDENLASLVPLYLVMAFFCADMGFLAMRLLKKSTDIY